MSKTMKGAIAGGTITAVLIGVALIFGPQWSFYLVLIACGAAFGTLFALEFEE